MKNNKGMTLVELIVGFALTGIFMAAAVIVLSSSMRVFVRANNVAHAQTVTDMLFETMTSELSAAADAGFKDTLKPMIVNGDSISFVDKNAYPVIMSKDEDGHLYLEYQEVKDAVGDVEKMVRWQYQADTYLSTKISELNFEHIGGNLIKISMTLASEKSDYTYEAQRIIECYNLDEGAIQKG